LLPVVRWLLPVSRVERNLDQLEAMLARETDYAHERENMERVRAMFSGRSDVVVPKVVHELTGGGVLTMSFEEGIKITDIAAEKRSTRTAAAAWKRAGAGPGAGGRLRAAVSFVMLFGHGIFPADPHPGNFLVRPGRTLVIRDYGAVEEVTPALADGMRIVVLGAMTRNDDQILAGLERMGFVAPGGDRELLKRVGREYLKALASVKIDDFSKLDRDVVEKLSGMSQIRGRLREIMRSVEYPDGYFYVERTLALLFGLVG